MRGRSRYSSAEGYGQVMPSQYDLTPSRGRKENSGRTGYLSAITSGSSASATTSHPPSYATSKASTTPSTLHRVVSRYVPPSPVYSDANTHRAYLTPRTVLTSKATNGGVLLPLGPPPPPPTLPPSALRRSLSDDPYNDPYSGDAFMMPPTTSASSSLLSSAASSVFPSAATSTSSSAASSASSSATSSPISSKPIYGVHDDDAPLADADPSSTTTSSATASPKAPSSPSTPLALTLQRLYRGKRARVFYGKVRAFSLLCTRMCRGWLARKWVKALRVVRAAAAEEAKAAAVVARVGTLECALRAARTQEDARRAEVEALVGELAGERERGAALEGRYRREVEGLEASLDFTRRALEEGEARVGELEREVVGCVGARERDGEAWRVEEGRLQGEVRAAREGASAQVAVAREEVEGLRGEVGALTSALATARAGKDGAERRVEQVEGELREAHLALLALEKEGRDRVAEAERLARGALQVAQAQGALLATELEGKLSCVTGALKECQGRLEGSEARVGVLERGVEEGKAEVGSLERALRESEARANSLAARASALEVTLAETQAKAAGLETTLTEVQAKGAALETTLTETQCRATELETTLNEALSKAAESETTLSKTQAKVTTLEGQVASVEAGWEREKQALAQLKLSLQQAQDLTGVLALEVDKGKLALVACKSQGEERRVELERSLGEMRGRVREGEGEVQSLRAALATAQGELVGREKRARVMEEGKRAATLALEAEVRHKEEREAGFKAQVAALEKAAQATQARLDAQVAALGKELAGSRREVECGKVAKGEMGVSLAALEGRLKGVEGEREGLVARVGVLEVEVEVMRERGVVADREKEGLQASLSTTTAQLAEAHAKVSLLTLTLEESKAEALGLGEEVGKLQGEVGAMAVSLSTLHSHHQDSLSTSSLYLRKLRVSLLTTVLLVMALTATFLWGGGYNGAWAPHLLLGTSPTQDGGVMGSSGSGSGGPPSSLAASSSPFEGGMLGLSQGPSAVQKWGPEGGATGGDNGGL